MYCSRCGAKYEGNFCPNGCNSPYRAAPKPQKKAFPAWGIVLIVLGCIILWLNILLILL